MIDVGFVFISRFSFRDYIKEGGLVWHSVKVNPFDSLAIRFPSFGWDLRQVSGVRIWGLLKT